MINTFQGYNPLFENLSIHTFLAEIIRLRMQLTPRPELRSQSGWDNALNRYLQQELNKLRDTVENITYKETSKTKEELEAAAADTEGTLEDDYAPDALSADNTVMPPIPPTEVVWKLDGTDPNLPQLDPDKYPNSEFRAFIKGLDHLFVTATRLDSRHQSYYITKHEGEMLVNLLNVLYTLTVRKGGEVNRTDISVGTMPSQEPNTLTDEVK